LHKHEDREVDLVFVVKLFGWHGVQTDAAMAEYVPFTQSPHVPALLAMIG